MCSSDASFHATAAAKTLSAGLARGRPGISNAPAHCLRTPKAACLHARPALSRQGTHEQRRAATWDLLQTSVHPGGRRRPRAAAPVLKYMHTQQACKYTVFLAGARDMFSTKCASAAGVIAVWGVLVAIGPSEVATARVVVRRNRNPANSYAVLQICRFVAVHMNAPRRRTARLMDHPESRLIIMPGCRSWT